jgi:hypothetical protein
MECIQNDADKDFPIVACLLVAARTCLPSHCLAPILGIHTHAPTFGKYVTADELLKAILSLRSVPKFYIEDEEGVFYAVRVV